MEYQRFLSYLYLYEQHRKKNCIGFVKAEQKAEVLRLTIQMEEERRMDGRTLSICFYQPNMRQAGKFQKNVFDELVLEGKKTEFQKSYPLSLLPEGFRLEEQYGILLCTQQEESFYYGSVWKGNEIPLELFEEEEDSAEEERLENISYENPNEIPEEVSNEIPDDISDENPEEISEETAIENIVEEMVSEAENVSEEPETEDTFPVTFPEGKRITIGQLRAQSGEKNRYGSNPFLLQAYQKYGHILEAKLQYQGEERECIGVPGVYGNREKYMAELHQFPIFLSMSDCKMKTGEFGYWLHVIPKNT